MSQKRPSDKDYGTVQATARLPIPLKDKVFKICDDHSIKYPVLAEWLCKAVVEYAERYEDGKMPTPIRIVSEADYQKFEEVFPKLELRISEGAKLPPRQESQPPVDHSIYERPKRKKTAAKKAVNG